jgi:hypothetical protein
MKKLILTFILLLSFMAHSQSRVTKCSCCNKPKAVSHKKKPTPPKKKTVIVKPVKPAVAPVRSETNIIINNNFNYVFPQKVETKTQKDTIVIIKTVDKPLTPDNPEFEIYAGVIDPKQSNSLGYMIGANIMPSLHQIGKDGKERVWLNKLLIGFEFSGYDTPTKYVDRSVAPNTASATTEVGCDCEETTLGGFSVGGLSAGSKYDFKQNVRGFSLNLGVEIYKGWYLTSGVTGYRRVLILNGGEVATTRYVYLDAGIKKFIKLGNVYLSPMFKFNNEVTSFGLGFSYD